MKKLYSATIIEDVVFECDDGKDIKAEGISWIKEQRNWHNPGLNDAVILEIKSKEQIPKGWIKETQKHCAPLIWGSDDEITAEQWFNNMEEEYKEFLELQKEYFKLKEKFISKLDNKQKSYEEEVLSCRYCGQFPCPDHKREFKSENKCEYGSLFGQIVGMTAKNSEKENEKTIPSKSS